MLLQRLATGATAVKQARYRRGPTRGSEALYAHAQHNTRSLAMHGVLPRVLHFSALLYHRSLQVEKWHAVVWQLPTLDYKILELQKVKGLQSD